MLNDRHRCKSWDCPVCEKRAEAADQRRAKRAAEVGCACGNAGCDCEKWNAIYKAKFEDPDYYRKDQVRGPGCSLTSDPQNITSGFHRAAAE